MADAQRPGDGAAGADRAHIDWVAAERSPEFQQLVKKRRAFVYPATAFFLAWYFGFVILAGYAPDFMGERVIEGVTVGYLLALSQFIMTWVLAGLYLRRADRVFDPLATAAAQRAFESGQRGSAAAPTASRATRSPSGGTEAPR